MMSEIESTYNILKNLTVYDPKKEKIRLGNNADGGYVIVKDYEYDLYISCGISNDISFDKNFLSLNKKIDGLLFDKQTDKKSIDLSFSDKVYLIQKNIAVKNTETTTNLEKEIEPYKNVFLKMDIEGYEWSWIEYFNSFDKIKQFVVEIHGLFYPKWMAYDESWNGLTEKIIPNLEKTVKILDKINKTHHLIHFHQNSCDKIVHLENGQKIPVVCELTYIRKEGLEEIKGLNKNPLPINGLDYENCPNREQIQFNSYPFCFK